MEFKNKKLEQFEKDIEKKEIAVIGIGVSNIPLIDYLHEKKAEVSVFDDREEDKISKDILEKLYISCFGISDYPVNLVAKLYKTE